MIDYKISQENARLIAVGIYRDIGERITILKQNNPDDYEKFKAAHLKKQAVQTSVPNKRHFRNKPVKSR